MDFVKDISIAVRTAVAPIGPLVIPAIIAAVVLLVLFAKNSYKLFRVGLPFVAALAGAYIGAGLLGDIIKTNVPVIGDFVNPLYLAAGVVALVLGLLCAKFHKLTMFIIGAGIGVVAIDGLVKGLLWNMDFVNNIVDSVGGTGSITVAIVGVIILVICALLCALILKKFFKGIYILVTAIGGLVIAAALPAIFIFANTGIAEIAVIACAVIGLIFGIVNVCKQLKNA